MRINDLIELLHKAEVKFGDVEVMAVAPMCEGFLKVDEILHRKDYHDTTTFGKKLPGGDFISIEWRNQGE